MTKYKKFLFLLIVFFVIPLFTKASTAAPVKIQLQIPILNYTVTASAAEYFANIYTACLYIIVPLTIVAIIIAGIQWILSGGAPNKIKEAKTLILRAFAGLGLALFSYLILSWVGISKFSTPSIQYIEPIPTVFANNETSDADDCSDPSKPGCSSTSSSFNNIFLHQATAAVAENTFADCVTNGRIVQGKPADCPKCADVPELKQVCPIPTKTFSYANAGTIGSSGCGIVSLTMVLNYFKKSVTIQQIADLAKKFMYRRCSKCTCTADGCIKPGNRPCTADDCEGTKYDTFAVPQQQAYGPSGILQQLSLKGEILTGREDEAGYDPKKTILGHLEKGDPIIISTNSPKVTGHAHFIVLIGCTDCFDDDKRKIFYRDPNMYSSDPFTKSSKGGDLFKNQHILGAFWINSGGGSSSGAKCSATSPCSGNNFCNDSGDCIAKRKTGEICTRNEMCLTGKCDTTAKRCL